MTKEEVKTKLQKLIAAKLPNDIPEKTVYDGVPPSNDSDQLVLSKDLRLTKSDLDDLAQDISDEFSIHFPIDEAEGASTLGDLVTAVFKHITASVGAVAGLAMAMHMGQVRCPNCGHVMGKKKKTMTEKASTKKKPKTKR